MLAILLGGLCRKVVDHSKAEDVFFSNCVEAGFGEKPLDGMHLSSFCSQNNFLTDSFGAHRIHDSMAKAQIPAFLDYCPEARPFIDDP